MSDAPKVLKLHGPIEFGIKIEANPHLAPDQAMLIDNSVMAQLELLAAQRLCGTISEAELEEKVAALGRRALRDKKVVLIENIGKEPEDGQAEEEGEGS